MATEDAVSARTIGGYAGRTFPPQVFGLVMDAEVVDAGVIDTEPAG